MTIQEQFSLVLHENICCEYSLEAPIGVLLMSTHNIPFYGEIRKKISPDTPP